MFLPNITIVIKSSFIIRSETFQIQIVEPSELIYQSVFKGFLFCVIEEGGLDGTMQFLMAFNMNLMTLFIPDKMCFHVRRSLLLGDFARYRTNAFLSRRPPMPEPCCSRWIIVRPRTEYLDCCFCFVEEEAVFLGGWRGWLPNYWAAGFTAGLTFR